MEVLNEDGNDNDAEEKQLCKMTEEEFCCLFPPPPFWVKWSNLLSVIKIAWTQLLLLINMTYFCI